jgi:SAM-dependent methyltransferase
MSTRARLPDPFRDLDAQPDPGELIARLEERGATPAHVRLRRAFLRFAGVAAGASVLEVGSGSGAVARDIGGLVGPRGSVVGVDPSRISVAAARRLARRDGLQERVRFRVADGRRLPFARDRFDVSLAVTVLLHVEAPDQIVAEMIRVTRSGGVVAVQDQDFGTLALAHPDRRLTARILDGVVEAMYAEPWSGRRLPGLLARLGLRRVRLLTSVYQDTTLEPYTKTFLERRAEQAVTLGIVDVPTARGWLRDLTALVGSGGFVMTLNFYGAAGIKP